MDHSSPPGRPPLDSLDTVCVAARHESFSAAAEALGLTHGAVSRRIATVDVLIWSESRERAAARATVTYAIP